MATATAKACCVICGKGKATLKCTGCSQHFCYNHVAEHRQELNQQLDEVELNRDVFRQTLTDQTTDSKQHPLIKQIDKWERESIHKIRQTAEEAKQLVLQHTIEQIARIEVRLNKLTDELREGRQENDFFETDLKQWKEELKRLTEELATPSNIKLQQDSTPLVSRIYVNVTSDNSKCG
jgi:chromosome segregation ATPase